MITRPAPGSAVFIEFYEYDNKLYVKPFYKETAQADEKIFSIEKYIVVKDKHEGAVGIEDFQRFLNFKLYAYDSKESWGSGILNNLPVTCR